MSKEFQNFHLIDSSIVKRDITILRDKNSTPEKFRVVVKRLSQFLAVEISKQFKLEEFEVETPLEKTIGYKLSHEIVIVPVLRAGLGMVDGFLRIIPEANVGHIGMQRNEETLEPEVYYFKTPKNLSEDKVLVIDPMLATGGSASAALNYLKEQGAKDIIFACIVAAPKGIKKIEKDHPDVAIYGTALDRELNDKGFILPGLGDAGDRTFGTL